MEYSTNVTNLIEGYSLEALIADKRTYYSVMKNVEVVGEAAYIFFTEYYCKNTKILAIRCQKP